MPVIKNLEMLLIIIIHLSIGLPVALVGIVTEYLRWFVLVCVASQPVSSKLIRRTTHRKQQNDPYNPVNVDITTVVE